MLPLVIRTKSQLREVTDQWQAQNLRHAIVPTMGALHDGHLTLVQHAFTHADKVIATIFVNPKQFAANEDLGRYPRDEEGDIEKLSGEGTDVVYIPTPGQIYPENFATEIAMEGPAKAGLEDKFRPHFFDGVATVVAKLFIQSAAHVAIFGEKDFQQLLVVRQMARDMDLNIDVIGIPTIREEDGLAKSSRNRYLSKHERNQATAIYKAMSQAADKIRSGSDQQQATKAAARSLTTLGFNVDYVSARNAETLEVPKTPDEPMRILAAAWLGKTRLIDNIAV
jgi:pantoate--beta-alanine ligase